MENQTNPTTVDHRGRPFSHSSTGGWKASFYIIGMEIAERFTYYGIATNLITYMTGPLGKNTASAAANVNAWTGMASMLPLLGGLLADCYLGRYRTILVASAIYLLGLSMLTLSAVVPHFVHPKCSSGNPSESEHCDPASSRTAQFFFFFAIYAVALAQGTMAAILVVNYVEDYVGWGLGFGIPCIAMVIALILFVLGTRTYRYYIVTVAFTKNVREFTFSLEVTGILKLLPIWATCLVYAVIFSQTTTLYTKQGSTLDRRIGSNFKVPPAALQTFIAFTIVVVIPIYDRVLVPLARKVSGIQSGITMLQRIGTGQFLSLVTIVIAALVEMKRLKTAKDFGLVDLPKAMVPMSLWWLVPQYMVFGIADVFTMIGMQEFFYDQAPDGLRSFGLALYLSVFGIGSFISSILVTIIDKVTNRRGDGWFSNNLNRAHIDYFYWLLAGLSALELLLFLYFARSYRYSRKS